jgi:AcrR family transcriptional regulator
MKSKSARGAATRQKILEAAAELVNRKGFNGTSVDDVLAASGTGKSQFYHYFTSKTQLARELVDHHAAVMPLARLADPDAMTGLAELDAALDALVEAHKGGHYPFGCPTSNLATELVSSNEELAGCFREIFESLEAKLAEAVRRLRFRGHVRQDVEPEAVASFVAAALEGALLLAKIRGGSAPLEATAGQLKGYLRGLASKPQTATRTLSAPKPALLTYCP